MKLFKNMMKNVTCTLLVLLAAFAIHLAAASPVSAATIGKVSGLKQVSSSDTSVKISWDSMLGVSNYGVWISEDGNQWVKDDTNSYYSGYWINGLTAGKTYYVKVQGFDGGSWNYPDTTTNGTFSDVISVVTRPEKVTSSSIVQTDATTNSITLSWGAVSGATGYQIMYNTTSDRSTAKVVESATNSVKLTNLVKDTEYYVWICTYRVCQSGFKAIDDEYAYTYTYGWRVVPSKVTGVTCTTFYPYTYHANITWNSNNAEGYNYQLATYSGKKLVNGSVRWGSVSFGSKHVKKRQFYKIRVQGYVKLNNGKTYTGEWSNWYYFCRQPQDVSARNSGKKITVSWETVKGATKYNVYVSTKEKSGYKKVGSTKKKSLSFTKVGKSKVKSGKKYYIRVQATRKVGKTTFKNQQYYTYTRSYTCQ